MDALCNLKASELASLVKFQIYPSPGFAFNSENLEFQFQRETYQSVTHYTIRWVIPLHVGLSFFIGTSIVLNCLRARNIEIFQIVELIVVILAITSALAQYLSSFPLRTLPTLKGPVDSFGRTLNHLTKLHQHRRLILISTFFFCLAFFLLAVTPYVFHKRDSDPTADLKLVLMLVLIPVFYGRCSSVCVALTIYTVVVELAVEALYLSSNSFFLRRPCLLGETAPFQA
jgi:hypothetical protein